MATESQGKELERFFRALWKDAIGIAELRLIPPSKQLFFQYPEELPQLVKAALEHDGQHNVYFGVCLRSRKSGRKEDVSCATALWTDVDWKTTPKDKIEKMLKTFPLKPTLEIMSGAGYHIYWSLLEPAQEPDELALVEATNKAIGRFLGGDHTHDLSRILRVPLTKNIKYDPPLDCTLVVSRPEMAYNVSDFDFLGVAEEIARPALVETPEAPGKTERIDLDSFPLSDLTKRVIREGLPAYIEFRRSTDTPEQFEGRKKSRSEADAWCITQLLTSGFTDAQIYWIWRDQNNRIGEKYRERRDGDKYLGVTIREMKRFLRESPRPPEDGTELEEAEALGEKIRTGGADRSVAIIELATLYRAQSTEMGKEMTISAASKTSGIPRDAIRKDIKAVLEAKKSKLPDTPKGRPKITKLVKFDARPPIWEITLEIKGTMLSLRTDTETLTTPRKFNNAFFDEHNLFPLPAKYPLDTWRRNLETAQLEVQKESSHEATPRGYLVQAIQDFEGAAQPSKGGIMALKVAPIQTDEGEIVLRLPSLMRFLKVEGIEKRTRSEVISILRQLGYSDELRRIGPEKEPTRVWYRPLPHQAPPSSPSSNGNPQNLL